MKTVLGLSVTSHGIAWALVDGRGAGDTTLDDDAFEVDATDQLAVRATAAARSAQAIAASSGQNVASIGVSAAGADADEALGQLLDLLAAAGFDDVRIVPDDFGTEAAVRGARAAALAVATNAVVRTPRPAPVRAPAPRRYPTVRAAAAAVAAIATGLMTVGSQHVDPVPVPAAVDTDVNAAAEPQLVTVVSPREESRSVARPEDGPVAQRADRAPIAQPAEQVAELPAETAQPTVSVQTVAVAETPAAQPVPILPAAAPAQAPAVPAVPMQQSATVNAAHLPAVQAHLPGAEAHVAADPSPGPALASPGSAPAPAPMLVPAPAPAPAPAPPSDPISGWLLAAMP